MEGGKNIKAEIKRNMDDRRKSKSSLKYNL